MATEGRKQLSRHCLVAYLYNDWPEPQADLTKPFDLDTGVTIQRVEPWMRSGSVAKPLGRIQQEILAEPRRFVIAVDYEAEDAASRAVAKLQDATIALWLAKPSAVGSRLRLHLRHVGNEEWVPTNIGTAVRFYSLETYKNEGFTAEDLRAAQGLYASLAVLPEEGPVRMGATLLLGALHEASWPLRYAQLWIGLEGLFGAESGGEVIFQLAYRMAVFLRGRGSDGRDLFRRVKKDYTIRSAIVHGMRERKIADSNEMMATAEGWLQQSLVKILLDATLTEKFNGETRDAWLGEMIFDAGA